jgi:hypothetical protein
MRFKTLLIHRCTLLIEGEVTGTDPYGRDIIGTVEKNDVPCRADQIRTRSMTDDTGTDFILDYVLYVGAEQTVTLNTKVQNITDKQGNPVLQGSFSALSVNPIYDRNKLHHYEITLLRD